MYPKHLERHKQIYERHQAGETYTAMATQMGLSSATVRSLAKRWERELTRLSRVENDIWAAICRERDYQDEKWGDIHTNPHSIFEWIGIMEKELQEAKAAYFQRPANNQMLQEVLQVVSVGVACMEQHGIIERERS